MALVEKRYAEALLNLSVSRNDIEAYRSELGSFLEVYNGNDDLRRILLNDTIEGSIKVDILQNVLGGRLGPEILNFLKLLVEKQRIKHLPGIYTEFNALADKKTNTIKIEIYSAFPLDELQIEGIKEKYRQIYGTDSARALVTTDRSLIGGIKVKIGDRVVDATLKSRLEELKKVITE